MPDLRSSREQLRRRVLGHEPTMCIEGVHISIVEIDPDGKLAGVDRLYNQRLPLFFSPHFRERQQRSGLAARFPAKPAGAPIILADMGAGAGPVVADWFESILSGAYVRIQRRRHARLPPVHLLKTGSADHTRLLYAVTRCCKLTSSSPSDFRIAS